MIPEDEIWLKMGGDKGGGRFKMSLQIANVVNPNSIHNTFVFSLFLAGGSVTNLHVALDGFKEQVQTLSSSSWR